MKIQLEASKRIAAAHDKSRNEELQKVRKFLVSHDFDVQYNPDDAQLYLTGCDDTDVQEILDTVGKEYKLRIDPGVSQKNTFAVKSPKGLVVQRLHSDVRIFFTK